MPFNALNPRLQPIAESGLRLIVGRYGKKGLQYETKIDDDIHWTPTFHVKVGRLLVAVEVDETLYPPILKIAAHDILRYDIPVAVYLTCPLSTFQSDREQRMIRALKKHGFGIITVDSGGTAVLQHPCIPLAQHIPEDEFEIAIRGLTPSVKVLFRTAYTTYETREGQGLQEAGQIVEGIVNAMADAAVKKKLISKGALGTTSASTIDALYNLFTAHRGSLGGARDFIKEYRNIASHAPRSPQQAMEKIRRCRDGFLRAIRTAEDLHKAMRQERFQLRLHIT